MPAYPPLFADRCEAGRRLGEALRGLKLAAPIIYALPRGGVPVAVEIGKALGAPVDVLLVRKIGAPGAPELALAAVVDGGEVVVNEDVRRLTGATTAFLDAARLRELDEIERRRSVYLNGQVRLSAGGRTAIVVDDGLATGATAKAALRALRREGAAKVVLAVPVAPAQTLVEMRREADEVFCLEPSEDFIGVGGFYGDFHQLSDDETVRLLSEARTRSAEADVVARSTVAIPPEG
jgi:predicted phosphoribosyltransferase